LELASAPVSLSMGTYIEERTTPIPKSGIILSILRVPLVSAVFVDVGNPLQLALP
jgi:hypothetical protein